MRYKLDLIYKIQIRIDELCITDEILTDLVYELDSVLMCNEVGM